MQAICPAGYFCPEGTGEGVRRGIKRGVRLGSILWVKEGAAGYHNKAVGVQEIYPAGYFCPKGTGKWVKRGIERGGVYSWGRRKGQLGTPKRQQGCRRYVQLGTSVQREQVRGSENRAAN